MRLSGTPSPKQAEFFRSTAKFTAYGGARGGGKSWALRRKLIAMCLRYHGIRCLIVRRTLAELRQNHVIPLLNEIGREVNYSAGERIFRFKNGSIIQLGYLACDADTLRYQGQEYDVIAIDEATQLTEYQFSTLKGCLRGVGDFPRRMYLTCNPGGVGHAYVKRLFIDRSYKNGECPNDYKFIQAFVTDNKILMNKDPEYVKTLKSLPETLRSAWLEGKWDLFEGQFFPEFRRERHVSKPFEIPPGKRFAAFDYGFDRFALLLFANFDGRLCVYREYCRSGLTLSEAAEALMRVISNDLRRGCSFEYAVCSPDLWNRRQDSGLSGYEIMSRMPGMPPLIRADSRRIPGWRAVRELLGGEINGHNEQIYDKIPEFEDGNSTFEAKDIRDNAQYDCGSIHELEEKSSRDNAQNGQSNDKISSITQTAEIRENAQKARSIDESNFSERMENIRKNAQVANEYSHIQKIKPPRLVIFESCHELINSMESLLFDPSCPEDASGEPHEVTHAPEALRYAVMSRPAERSCMVSFDQNAEMFSF